MESSITIDTARSICAHYDIIINQFDNEAEVSGSPERTEERVVVVSNRENRYLLEKIHPGTLSKKKRISDLLEQLHRQSIPVLPPISVSGQTISKFYGAFWQLTPYHGSLPLCRPDYVNDPWRGKSLGKFWVSLQKAEHPPESHCPMPLFSMRKYILSLMDSMKKHAPRDIFDRAEKTFGFLTTTRQMEKIESLKNIFSHGDLHPLNVLWGPNFIKYVIDWEFSGYKPEVYDLANLIGCLGIEHPTALGGPLTSEFIKYIKQHHIVTDNGWQALPGMILANRFAWLSEWLRKNDHEMILMELDYFDLLMEHHEDMVHFFTELSF